MSQGSAKKSQQKTPAKTPQKTPQTGSVKKVMRARSRSQSRSPIRKIKQKQPKSSNQIIKLQKKENFNKEIDLVFKQQKQIKKLSNRFEKAKTSHNLTFQKNGETRTLTRLELSNMEQELDKKNAVLKKLYLEGTKHTKSPNLPESFKAAYQPVKLGPVFIQLLGPDAKKKLPNFGGLVENDAFVPDSNLLDSLPRAREGLVLKTSVTLLMYIYCTVNNLKSKEQSKGQINIPDDRMNNVFGKLNSLYYQEAGSPKTINNKKLSTYAVVSGKNTDFNPEKIENYYFQAIQSLNIYEAKDLAEADAKSLKNDKLRAELLEEFYLIKAANNLHKKNKKA